jgi:hypothetical protein
MSLREHVIYWILPLFLTTFFIVFYYAGPPLIQNIIAPSSNRELGLLENLAHILLLSSIVIVFKGIVMIKDKRVRSIYFFLFISLLFLFLEEIDYGLHWVEMIKGLPVEEQSVVRNLHNRGGHILDIINAIAHISMGILFIIVPYFLPQPKNKLEWFSRFIPSKKMIFTLLTVIVTGILSAFFEELNLPTNESLAGNRAEFDELVTYYAAMLFFYEAGANKKEVSESQIF